MPSNPKNLRIPGPTPVPSDVMAAMQREMIPHRGPAFRSLYAETLRMARLAHRTDGDVLLWPASGSAGWEVAIVNLFSPGDPVLATVCGDFGERFARVAATLGLDVRRLDVPWGRSVTPTLLRTALEEHHDVKGVLLTHNETSTGVANPLAGLAAVVQEQGALVVVDSVSGVGGLPFEMDAWGIDFVLSGSQKAWMCPPGLLICGVGPRALDAAEWSSFPRFYWDLRTVRTLAAEGMTPTTPAISLIYAFHAALGNILERGMENVWAEHRAWGEFTRAGVRGLGLSLYAESAFASDTVTGIALPDGVSAKAVVKGVREATGIEIGAGQGKATDIMLRIGHMGWCDEASLRMTLDALAHELSRHGIVSPAKAVAVQA